MLRPLVAIVSLFALAGCLSPEAEAPVEAASADDAGAMASAENAMAQTPAVDDAQAAPPLVETPIAYEGSTPQGACTMVSCHFEGGSEDFHVIDVVGQPVKLTLTITYGEQIPGHEFYASVCHGEDESADCSEYETGASPLVIEYDLAAHPSDSPMGVSVGSVNFAAGAAGLMTFGPADFSVEGVLVTVAN